MKKGNITLIGGALSAILTSACCIGPIIFALLGISSAGLIGRLESYRSLALILTIILLATSIYFVYRKKSAEECVEGSYCANPKSEKLNKRILWIATFLILGILTFPYWSIYLA